MALCILGLRTYILKLFPTSILMAGAAGIGVFISFVGVKSMGMIVGAPFPTLLSLNLGWPYTYGGWGPNPIPDPPSFNSCVMYFQGGSRAGICWELILGADTHCTWES